MSSIEKRHADFSEDLSAIFETDIIDSDEFISSIDIPRKILIFLDTEVKDGYLPNEKMKTRFKMLSSKWKEIRELPLFANRIFNYTRPDGTRDSVWSSEKGIDLAKNTISMTRYEVID